MAKEKRLGFYGSGGQFTLIYREMRVSDAYRVLTPKQKLLLIDMVRVYRKVSRGDKVYVKDGFEYVWEVCEEDVSESAFYRIRQRLVDFGFFEYPEDLQKMRAGTARIFLPSRGWASYKATSDEAKKLTKWNRTKKARIRDKQRRLIKYRTSLGDDENRSGVSERGRSDMLERGRSNPQETGSTCSNEADPGPKTGVSHMLERGRCSITIPIGAAEPDHEAKVAILEVNGVENAEAVVIDDLLAEIEVENRRANLQAVWPGEKPDLHVLLSLTADAPQGEPAHI